MIKYQMESIILYKDIPCNTCNPNILAEHDNLKKKLKLTKNKSETD